MKKVGAHVAVQGDYRKMRDYSLSVGCECAQIFAKNARQYRYAPPKPERLNQMKQVVEQNPDFSVYSHTAYLINLSSLDDEIRAKSIESMAGELALAAMLGLAGVNTHVGNDKGHDMQAAAARAADSICRAHERADAVLEEWLEKGLVPVRECGDGGLPELPVLILEDAAGAGDLFGCTVEQISTIIDDVRQLGLARGNAVEHMAVCIDTCHAWAEGYDVSTQAGWNELLDQIDGSIGLGHLRLLHSNDSKFGCGEHKDRHEWVGEGHIGAAGFEYMMRTPRITNADVILEVPGEVPQKDEVNIALLKRFRDGAEG